MEENEKEKKFYIKHNNQKKDFINLNKKKNEEEKTIIKYISESIKLLSQLSLGRNYNSITIVSKDLISYEMVIRLIFHEEVENEIKYNLINLLEHVYVDVKPIEKKNYLYSLIRVKLNELKIKNWENIENKSEFLYDDKLIIYKFINKENQNLKIDLKNEILKYIQNNRYLYFF
jgi:hypothetical protein